MAKLARLFLLTELSTTTRYMKALYAFYKMWQIAVSNRRIGASERRTAVSILSRKFVPLMFGLAFGRDMGIVFQQSHKMLCFTQGLYTGLLVEGKRLSTSV